MSSTIYVKSIQSIADFRESVRIFCHEMTHTLDGISHDIVIIEEWILEKKHYWHRRAEDDDEDQEAYDELQNIVHWENMLEQVVQDYKLQANRLSHWVHTGLPNAQKKLTETVKRLDRYTITISPSSNGTTSTTTNVLHEKISSESSQISFADTEWIERGICKISIKGILNQIDFEQSHVKGPSDFLKVTYDEMVTGLHKLQNTVLPAVEQGADKDYFAKLDRKQGLPFQHGYQRIYEAFYGAEPIRVEKNGENYNAINGYHRLFVAKKLGIKIQSGTDHDKKKRLKDAEQSYTHGEQAARFSGRVSKCV